MLFNAKPRMSQICTYRLLLLILVGMLALWSYNRFFIQVLTSMKKTQLDEDFWNLDQILRADYSELEHRPKHWNAGYHEKPDSDTDVYDLYDHVEDTPEDDNDAEGESNIPRHEHSLGRDHEEGNKEGNKAGKNKEHTPNMRSFTMGNPVTVYVQGTFFGFHTFLHQPHLFEYTKECKVPCRFITRTQLKGKKCITHQPMDSAVKQFGLCDDALDEADIILREKPWRYLKAAEPHKDGQLTAFLSVESGHYDPQLWSNKRLGQIEMTFRKQANIRVNYFSNVFQSIPDLYHKISHSIRRNAVADSDLALSTAFISNCQETRHSFVRGMQQAGMTIDIYGKCQTLVNKDEAKDCAKYGKTGLKRARSKQFLSGLHKFVLAFENRQVNDYVTEKYFQALVSGAIPVYRGAPNIKDYLPSLSHPVIINTDDFATSKELVDYMYKVAYDKKLYESYFKWKTMPLRKEFLDMFTWTRDSIPCRICDYAATRIDVKGKRYLGDNRDLAEEALIEKMQHDGEMHPWLQHI
eukprot:CFRG0941T1